MPWQKIFRPPPLPVDSTTGVLNPLVLPNCSATVVENGRPDDSYLIARLGGAGRPRHGGNGDGGQCEFGEFHGFSPELEDVTKAGGDRF